MTAPASSVRWQLLTDRLDLRARWRTICNDLAARTDRDPPLIAVPPITLPPFRAPRGTPLR